MLSEGLADLYGNPVPIYPYLHVRGNSPYLLFNPTYQHQSGADTEIDIAGENGNGGCVRLQQKQLLVSLLPLLSKRRRQIVEFLFAGCSIPEIAARLNCSYANVHAHLYGDGRYGNSGAVNELRRLLARGVKRS